MLRAKERGLTPHPSVVFNLGLTFEPLKELGVRHMVSEPMLDDFGNVFFYY